MFAFSIASIATAQPRVRMLFRYMGDDPKVAAEQIVHNLKFGMNMVEQAIDFGDPVIPHIVEQSKSFELLNDRNGRWVTEVLGSIESKLSQETLLKMYRHERLLVRYLGAIGLGMQDKLPKTIDEKWFVLQKIKDVEFVRDKSLDDFPNIKDEFPETDYETDLAITALGYSKYKGAAPVLRSLFKKEPQPYFDRYDAFLALTRLGDSQSIEILREHFEDYGGDKLFRMLICLGDKRAVPLSFHQLGDKYDKSLIREVEFVTGQRFGRDDDRWRQWWKQNGKDWRIPEAFRVHWDEQPESPRRDKVDYGPYIRKFLVPMLVPK